MSAKHIESLWQTYKVVLPKDAGATQIIETRRAFYAGAGGLFEYVCNMMEPGTEATDNDLKKMDEIHAEIHEFVDLVKNGVA